MDFPWISLVALGYLLGSFPSAYIVGRLSKGVDIREVGDRNMGAANTFREIGAGAGLGVLVADVGKGALAILAAQWAGMSQPTLLLAGGATVAGHNWPLWLGFRGGRGAATACGVLAMLLPQGMLLLLGLAAITFFLTHSVIWACAALFAPLPLVAWWLRAPAYLVLYVIALPCLVGFTHYLTTRPRAGERNCAREKLP